MDPALAQLEKDDQIKHMPSRRPPPSPACFPEEEQMRKGWKQQAITTALKQSKAGGGLQVPIHARGWECVQPSFVSLMKRSEAG